MEQTNRELLEAAARAAGLTIHAHNQAGRDACGAGDVGLWISNFTTCWNPLTDDGDALRLLTRLPFRELYVSEIGATVSWRRDDGSGHGYKCDEYAQEHGGDLSAATRRAIVRAAAAMVPRPVLGAA